MSARHNTKYQPGIIKSSHSKSEQIIPALAHLLKEVKSFLQNDESGRHPRKVVENYIYSLEVGSISYYFSHLLESCAEVSMSGNLSPTNPRMMAAMYLRVYLWKFISEDEKLRKKYETTTYASSFA